jgi:MscS family membrane protein
MNLENYTLRDKFAFHPTISLSYQTSVDQLREVLRKIREVLDKHGNVESQSAWARLIRIGNASQDIEIFAYVFAAEYNVFLGVQEQLLMLIMEIVETTGTALALPTQVTQVTQSLSETSSTTHDSRHSPSNNS